MKKCLVYQMSTNGIPSIDKSSIDKIRIDKHSSNNINNNNVDESCEDDLQDIIDFYNNNVGCMSPYCLEILKSYLDEMPKDLIILAMKKAVEANIRTIKYIKAILNNWKNKGIKTVIEAEKEDYDFKNKNKETDEEKMTRRKKEMEACNL